MAKAEHSKDFEKWKERFERHGCTKAQLRRLVGEPLNVITAEEYEEITGEKY